MLALRCLAIQLVCRVVSRIPYEGKVAGATIQQRVQHIAILFRCLAKLALFLAALIVLGQSTLANVTVTSGGAKCANVGSCCITVFERHSQRSFALQWHLSRCSLARCRCHA